MTKDNDEHFLEDVDNLNDCVHKTVLWLTDVARPWDRRRARVKQGDECVRSPRFHTRRVALHVLGSASSTNDRRTMKSSA